MKIVTNAQFVPGVCLICGGSDSDRPWFLDIEKQAEFWGNIYFCNFCCGTMVFLFRCGDVSEYEKRVDELESAGSELLERAKIYESAMAAIANLPHYDSTELARLLAHKNIDSPKPEFDFRVEPAGQRLAESSDDDQMGELPSFDFVAVQPDTTTGW